MAPPTKLAHVVYMTRRYDEMIAWYQQVFEAKIQYKNPALAFLTYDDEHHRFAFANMAVFQPDGADSRNQQGRSRRYRRLTGCDTALPGRSSARLGYSQYHLR